jgi:sulfatase maturation enzyme AslB (radical SAM superfamily)
LPLELQLNHEDFLKNLLAAKLPESSEVEIHAFEFCNLNCSFCGQDHDSTVGMNTIAEKAHQTVEFIMNSPLKKHTVNFMGGEIFNDAVGTEVFLQYLEFYEIIKEACRKMKVGFQINWVTNLIFTENREMVDWLMEKTGKHSKISTSYDFAGRGLNLNRRLMFEFNMARYKKYIGVVGFVFTAPAIRKLIAGKDKYFLDVLYPNYPLYFDWYVPEKSAAKMMPSEQEMLDGLLFLAERFPQVEPVKSLLENKENKMTCFSLNKTTIQPDGTEVKCRYMEYDDMEFLSEVDYSTNANIIQKHLDRHDCLSCEWYDKCQFRCFVNADWAKLERLSECMFKLFFDKTKKLHV